MHSDVEKACRESLDDLQLDYFDLYLVHWPFPNYHPPGCDVNSRNPDSSPFIADAFIKTWRQMESLVKEGIVRNIGTSNITIPKLEAILPMMEFKPAVNEMEIHPCFQQEELFQYLVNKNIQPIGYSPIGSPNRPDRDKTAGHEPCGQIVKCGPGMRRFKIGEFYIHKNLPAYSPYR